eukprot:TRINITY_DN940_c0_g1_i1.p1 TRINITY_DN940_c0_g1~~TRINITY_DN940_c0_g1_i1.p1  ORF type:complete len:458 (+),score=129.64 TRINITY_DN940_c0_g1_i1:109-1374(+)
MIHSIFILNEVGDVLFEKHYRGLVQRSVCDYFWEQVTAASSPEEVPPVIVTPHFYLFNILHSVRSGNMYFIALTTAEVNPLLVIEFLHRVEDVFTEYFGQGFGESALKEEFVKVYQLLEEMMDNGFPFTTEPNILREMVRAPNIVEKVSGAVGGTSSMTEQLPSGTLSIMPWRKEGVKYSTNEVFFDIIEEVDAIMDLGGNVVSSEVVGTINVNCRLSAMPDLTLTFTNPALLDDVGFHPCVRHNRWEQNRNISFIPPDGQFRLMSYTVKGGVQPPVVVRPQIRFTDTGGRVDVNVSMVHNLQQGKTLPENVVITIPFPKGVLSANLSCTVGTFALDQKTKVCTWTIGRMPKEKMPNLSGTVTMQVGATRPESNPVLSAQFTIAMYTASGITVDSLVVAEHYKPFKGVRSLTKGGRYQIRS